MIHLKIALSLIVQWLKEPLKRTKYLNKVKYEMERISNLKLEPSTTEAKGTLIIKTDDIGDFILWTPVIESIRQNAERPIYFVGNQLIKPLYEEWFKFADEVLWIDKSKCHNEEYRDEVYRKVIKWNPKVAFTPLFTRNFFLDDMILFASKAKEKIAWDVKHHQYYSQANFMNKFLSRNIETVCSVFHEITRNQEFVQNLYALSELPSQEWNLNLCATRENTLVVVPNASVKSKQLDWPVLTEIIKDVIHMFDKVMIVGGKDAIQRSEQITKALNSEKVINYSGAKSLVDLVKIISASNMVLTPDTAALHIAVATHTPTVVLSNGTMVPRFTDYTKMAKAYFAMVLPVGYSRIKFRVRYSSAQMQLIRRQDVVHAILEGLKRKEGL